MTETQRKTIVWTIAGSDSGGGAGIQADLHTIEALGAHGCSVVTAITAQNSTDVRLVAPVTQAALTAQWQALADDLPAAVVKIGLLANPEQVHTVATALAQLKQRHPAVKALYDPVATASTGSALTTEPIAAALSSLLPLLDLITPNAQEAERLTGIAVSDYNSLRQAAAVLRERGVASVVIKGGHSALVADHCIDYLRSDAFESDTTEMVLAQPRLANNNNHGSGCSFASACAAVWAQGYALEDAVLLANAYVHRGIRTGTAIGRGAGPVAHGPWPESADDFPQVVLPGSPLATQLGWQSNSHYPVGFARCDRRQLGLYPVVDSCEWLQKLLREGVKTLQLRIKNQTGDALRHQLQRAIELGRQHKARLFINDYWQLAIELGAYGVHLGQEDMARANLVAIQNAGLKLGLSTHGYFELLRALAVKPSYVASGAIYPTTTKTMPSKPQGLVKLRRYLQLIGDTPAVAIGGINRERAAAVAACGVGSIAVVTAITEADDYRAAVAELTRVITPDQGGVIERPV